MALDLRRTVATRGWLAGVGAGAPPSSRTMLTHLATALEATVLLSTAAALAIGVLVRSGAPAAARPAEPSSITRRVVFHPLAQFLFVCGVLYANQVLFSAYILRAHGGSAAFIARYIPGPWFAIGRHDPLVGLVAQHVGDGRWLAPSLLRVQAFLELPFTMFAYLAVARLLGVRLYATLCRLPILALVALSFSATFSIIELSLPNPYTTDDLVLRAISGVVMPVYMHGYRGRSDRGGPTRTDRRASSAPRVPRGRGRHRLPRACALRRLSPLQPRAPSAVRQRARDGGRGRDRDRGGGAPHRRRAGPRARPASAVARDRSLRGDAARVHAALLRSVAGASLLGGHASAVLCGLLVVGLGFFGGVASMLRRVQPSAGAVLRLLLAIGVALGAAGWAARAAIVSSPPHGLPELVLARGALSFLVVAIVVLRGVEIALCWASHETKAQLTKREKKALGPPRPAQQSAPAGGGHIHCIACGKHLDPNDFEGPPPRPPSRAITARSSRPA